VSTPREDRMSSVQVALRLLTSKAKDSSRIGDLILKDLDEALWKLVDEYVDEKDQVL